MYRCTNLDLVFELAFHLLDYYSYYDPLLTKFGQVGLVMVEMHKKPMVCHWSRMKQLLCW